MTHALGAHSDVDANILNNCPYLSFRHLVILAAIKTQSSGFTIQVAIRKRNDRLRSMCVVQVCAP